MQPLLNPVLSMVVPVYGNEQSIDALLAAMSTLATQVHGGMEVVLVVDGSPDRSHALLRDRLPETGLHAQLLSLSRNFGAFAAIRVGLEHARGAVIAVMAADLQEPPELALQFMAALQSQQADVAFGVRTGRRDPWLSRLASGAFWGIYRKLVMPEIPRGGVDIFAVTAAFRDRLVALRESNSSLVAQLFWLGGKRAYVDYERRPRQHGRSAWSLRKKLRYFSDSIFAFTDLPVRMLIGLGMFALAIALLLSAITLFGRLSGLVDVPGYTGTMLVILFFGAFNALGLGVVGTYAWRAFENTKARPLAVVQGGEFFGEDHAGENPASETRGSANRAAEHHSRNDHPDKE